MNKVNEFKANATGIQHLGIPTGDLKKTVAFYHELGFETVWEKTMKWHSCSLVRS